MDYPPLTLDIPTITIMLLDQLGPFAASGRAHGRAGLGGVRTAKEKAGLLEGKLEDLVALKSAGRLVP